MFSGTGRFIKSIKSEVMKMGLKETAEKLWDYEFNGNKPIAIVGSDGSNKGKLRVYAYGGKIGYIRISDGEFIKMADNSYNQYIQREEYFYGSDKKKRKNDLTVIDKLYPEEKNTVKLVSLKEDTKKYLDYIVTAAYNRQRRCNPTTKLYEPYTPSEKAVQCSITRQFMSSGEKRGWCICDFEYQDNTSNTETIGGRIDLIVYDYTRKQFGLVELKLNNDSTNNIKKHYSDSLNLISNKTMIDNLCKRCTELEKAGLIDSIKNADMSHMWFGFLFVGGHANSSAKIIKNCSDSFTKVDNCRFRYVESIEKLNEYGLTFESMEKFEDFIKHTK